MIKVNKNGMNLNETITCGQIFRFEVLDNKYIIVLNDRVIELYEDKEYLYVESSNDDDLEKVIINYFDLNRNYDNFQKEILKLDNSLKDILNIGKGLRIINQFPLETMISYIISANNSVRNIQKAINLLSEKYGEEVIYKNNKYYLFPTLKVLKNLTIDDFKNIKIGFRSKYVYDFIQNIDLKIIEEINDMDTSTALKYLMSYNGIGLKVASCILLFSYKRFDVFPIDTWVKKYMLDNYNIDNQKDIEKLAKEKYGNYSGLVIQYMFHSKRNKQS